MIGQIHEHAFDLWIFRSSTPDQPEPEGSFFKVKSIRPLDMDAESIRQKLISYTKFDHDYTEDLKVARKSTFSQYTRDVIAAIQIVAQLKRDPYVNAEIASRANAALCCFIAIYCLPKIKSRINYIFHVFDIPSLMSWTPLEDEFNYPQSIKVSRYLLDMVTSDSNSNSDSQSKSESTGSTSTSGSNSESTESASTSKSNAKDSNSASSDTDTDSESPCKSTFSESSTEGFSSPNSCSSSSSDSKTIPLNPKPKPKPTILFNAENAKKWWHWICKLINLLHRVTREKEEDVLRIVGASEMLHDLLYATPPELWKCRSLNGCLYESSTTRDRTRRKQGEDKYEESKGREPEAKGDEGERKGRGGGNTANNEPKGEGDQESKFVIGELEGKGSEYKCVDSGEGGEYEDSAGVTDEPEGKIEVDHECKDPEDHEGADKDEKSERSTLQGRERSR
ncbi:hypothetical protein BT96DRAFT_605956 [Gymnopus androsaceus JB14]|uniref:Uncharacterized protein n=1 Tax=Gymnopus androsaceus JB14 TaxID=1447944 RepID=A0A6A4GHN9_9AGAR|nr:hypothetical protein BT96DRAFT_605956 [Gymnopus androsaceus JB14]